MAEEDAIAGQIDELIEKGNKVLATYEPPSRKPGIFTMGDELDQPMLLAWRAQVQNFLIDQLGREHIYIQSLNIGQEVHGYRSNVEEYQQILKSVKEDIINDRISITHSVFIVHGRDSNAKYQLKDLLREWRVRPVILHEQPNRGRAIIEKFEDHSEEVRCAIVLLTPDDKGCSADTDDWKPRARQNVIFELGYFFAKLGRGKVICLHKGDVELPSDISGIIYIPFDTDLKKEVYAELRRELKAIEFNISD